MTYSRWVRASCYGVIAGSLLLLAPSFHSISVPNKNDKSQFKAMTAIIAPGDGAKDFDPSAPIAVRLFHGTLNTVTLTDQHGTVVPGIFSPDHHIWQPVQILQYNSNYIIKALANSDESPALSTPIITHFSTIKPSNLTKVYFRSSGSLALRENGVYGVGIVIEAHFDEPIDNKALAEKYLHVTATTPSGVHLQGSWYWLNDQDAHWRPKNYYPPNTIVTAEARVVGHEFSPGLYGEANSQVTFRIGTRHFLLADDATHNIKVFDNHQLIRTMPTSMGRGGYVIGVNHMKISLWTPSGIYTVIDRGNPVIMDSSSFGLPIRDVNGYKLKIPYATKISNDGIYLHELDTTVWAQGHVDTSHGCLNLNLDNASWFFHWAQEGDPVQVINTGGDPLSIRQNGDWSIPWEIWRKGSALHEILHDHDNADGPLFINGSEFINQ